MPVPYMSPGRYKDVGLHYFQAGGHMRQPNLVLFFAFFSFCSVVMFLINYVFVVLGLVSLVSQLVSYSCGQ